MHHLIMYVFFTKLVQRLTRTLFATTFLNENGLGNNKATLFLDSASCHLIEPVKDSFKDIYCNREFIRKRCTNMHQPFDVCMFGPIKRQLCGK